MDIVRPNKDESYIDWINRIRLLNRKFDKHIYTEKHHIIPRCMGGDNSSDNII